MSVSLVQASGTLALLSKYVPRRFSRWYQSSCREAEIPQVRDGATRHLPSTIAPSWIYCDSQEWLMAAKAMQRTQKLFRDTSVLLSAKWPAPYQSLFYFVKLSALRFGLFLIEGGSNSPMLASYKQNWKQLDTSWACPEELHCTFPASIFGSSGNFMAKDART